MKNHYATSEMPEKETIVWLTLAGFAAFAFSWLTFSVFHQLDMNATQSVFDGRRFPLRSDEWVKFVRKLIIWLTIIFYVVVLICGLRAYHRQKDVLSFVWHKWAFIGATALAGPVMLINVILKGNWGRARPQDVVEFGGSWDFTPFWIMGEQCKDNCSFASGEVSGVAMIFISLALLSSAGLRFAVFLVGFITCAFTGWIRVVMGSHFVSDTIVGPVLMLLVALGVYYLFYIRRHEWFTRLNAIRLEKMEAQRREKARKKRV